MRREVHVRFCERLGVRLPGPTLPHISGKNSLGHCMVRRKTIRKRIRGKLRRIQQQLRMRMHDPRYRETSQAWGRSVTGCWRYGGVLSAAGARNTGSRGRVLLPWLSAGFRNRARFIPFRMHALPPFICDKNRMR